MPDMEQMVSLTSHPQNTAFFECVKKAAELTHTLYLGKVKSQKAINAITTNDKNFKFLVLQDYLQRYTSFINSLTVLSGIYVFRVDTDFFKSITDSQLNEQLEFIIGFVYLKEALSSLGHETFKSCLKKLLKETGLFSDKQLGFL